MADLFTGGHGMKGALIALFDYGWKVVSLEDFKDAMRPALESAAGLDKMMKTAWGDFEVTGRKLRVFLRYCDQGKSLFRYGFSFLLCFFFSFSLFMIFCCVCGLFSLLTHLSQSRS